MKFLRRLVVFLLFCCGLVIFVVYWVQNTVEKQTSPYLYQSTTNLPSNQVGMVLGAQVLPNLIPSQALAYRLTTGIDLVRQQKVQKLLMSGDGRSQYYDEVATMKDYAIKAGLKNTQILVDPEGLHTYDSCYRAKNEFHLQKLTIITQKDHLLRSVFTCRKLGVDAIGVVAPEFSDGRLSDYKYWEYRFREKAALVLAWFEVNTGLNGNDEN